MQALLELLRISLLPTAAADALVGHWLGSSSFPATDAEAQSSGLSVPTVWLAVPASLCVYHGAMALNDWADRSEDERMRPRRPIPSGRICPATALAIAMALLALGVSLGLLVNLAAGALLGAVAVLAVLYDLRGRGAWRGPLLLGACRAGNLGFGVLAGTGGMLPAPWVLGGLCAYGLYVFSISRIGRLEDGPADQVGTAPSLWLLLAAAAMLALPLVRVLKAGIWTALPLALLGAGLLLRTALPVRAWARAQLVPTMGRALRLLLVMTAALALCQPGKQGLWTAAVVLCGYPLAHVLRKRFPPS